MNLALVARVVHAARTAPSRADVAAATFMTRATASRLVDELVGAAILDEAERPSVARRGRPVTPLLPGAKIAALGLQIDASFLAAKVVNLRGETLAEALQPGRFVDSDPVKTFGALAAVAREALARLPSEIHLVGTGLALPGIIDPGTERLLHAPNLGWSELDPAGMLADGWLPDAAEFRPTAGNLAGTALGPPRLTVVNEADLAATTVAYDAPGRPRPLSDFLYLSGGIGIGGATVRAGEVVTGRHGWAGEIGHVTVDPGGPSCRCGSTGCLEQYTGSQALAAAAGLAPTAGPERLVALFEAGDQRAAETVSRAAWALGVVLANAINILDIPTVVLGGHLGRIAHLLRPDLDRMLRQRVLSARWTAPSTLAFEQPWAPGATGAAYRILMTIINDPARRIARISANAVGRADSAP
ncbi:ROK family protein [Parafrankia sp. FMc6]|uniref:ROK family protein n=1 Tax=Parafrankia soli TaxID=2599596 RepID=UPI0034D7A3CF